MRQSCMNICLALLLIGCTPTERSATINVGSKSDAAEERQLPATGHKLYEVLAIPASASHLPCRDLTLKFEDMAGNERLKAFLHETIGSRSSDGIYFWSWRDDTLMQQFHALLIQQGRVTWYRRIKQGEQEPAVLLIHGIERSELLNPESAQLPRTCLRLYLNDGTMENLIYCVSVGA